MDLAGLGVDVVGISPDKPAAQEKFAATYKAAGGQVDFHVFPGSVHEWVAEPGPQTDRAREMVKAFIARNLKSGSRA